MLHFQMLLAIWLSGRSCIGHFKSPLKDHLQNDPSKVILPILQIEKSARVLAPLFGTSLHTFYVDDLRGWPGNTKKKLSKEQKQRKNEVAHA